jgi:hypothetical protein
MLPRSLLLVLTAFWLTMNALLWRAEYGGRPGLGSSVPAHVVWEKILTAPDSSSLTIFRRGQKIGFCHWVTSIGEDLSRLSANDVPPEGMVGRIANYRLELDGNVVLGEPTERLRFDSHLTLGRDTQLQEIEIRANLRPASWEIRSSLAQKTVRFSGQDEAGEFSRVYKFSDFEHPEALLQEFAGPFAAGLVSGLGLPSLRDPQALQTLGLRWEARHESLLLGHSKVRAYRLEARLLDRFALVVFVSRAGEILRVELPEGITLTNDQLGGN